ncbi:hypothetical protein TA3x_003490 [Tundrisphaera sp. TA3]|uniref:hypothetical protein n=1 Tax=Tundrisphaera sp. TA3 TaxID=3435775 RepID=UPI003EB89FF6
MPIGTIHLAALAFALHPMAWQDAPAEHPRPGAEPPLSMSPAVACRKIEGYELFEPLPDAAVTADEKLQVYYRPIGYKIERKGKQHVARFSQDGEIRRKGEKKVVSKKVNILEYEAKSDDPPYRVYLVNHVGLKGLPPGEYELTILLRDALRPGASASQVLPFRIIPTPAAPPGRDEPEPETPPSPARPGPRR